MGSRLPVPADVSRRIDPLGSVGSAALRRRLRGNWNSVAAGVSRRIDPAHLSGPPPYGGGYEGLESGSRRRKPAD